MSRKNNISTNRKPLTKGYARVPVMIQMETLECGAVSLGMVLAWYGLYLPLEEIRTVCGISRDGSNMKSMFLAAEHYGLRVQAYRYSVEDLRNKATYPCIIHWNFNHFVVLDGFKGKKVLLNDPARGYVEISEQELSESFTGVCMTFEPDTSFHPDGRPASVAAFIREHLKGSRSMLLLVILTAFITTCMAIFMPGFQGFFVDAILGRPDALYVGPFYASLLLISLLQLAATWCKASYLLKLEGKLGAVTNSSFIWHVLCLPVEFFEQRMSGDILDRYKRNSAIPETLVNKLTPLLMDLSSMVFYLAVMLFINVPLALLGLLSCALNLWISHIIAKKRVNTTRVLASEAGKLNSMTLSGIDMIETIKATGSEDRFYDTWAGTYAIYQNQNIKNARLDQTLGLLPSLIQTLTADLVLIGGVFLIINGSWLSGVALAFNGFLTAFQAPAASLISSIQTLQEMRTDMERVQDLMDYKTDVDPNEQYTPEQLKMDFRGNVELEHVTFGYNPVKPPILKDISLHVEPGEKVAIVGGSGSGKSTIARLITGLYPAQEGSIRIDGIPVSEIPHPILTSQVAYVTQNVMLFQDTIYRNITLMDSSISSKSVMKAASDAAIRNTIIKRDGGFQRELLNGGRDFSGGEQQRIEIASALARNPALLLLDEATAGLDAETEYDVMQAIAARNITTIIISHRLSIIRDCSRIYVLDHGKIQDAGTHEELMERCGIYRNLVSNN